MVYTWGVHEYGWIVNMAIFWHSVVGGNPNFEDLWFWPTFFNADTQLGILPMASITFLVSKKSNKDWCIEHLTSVCLAPWWEQFQLMMASTQTPPHTNTTKCKYTNSTTHEHNEIHIHIKCMQTKTQNKHKHTSQTHTHKSKTNKDTNKQAYSYKHNKFTETHRCKWKKPVIKEIIAIPNLCNKNTMFDISLFFCLFVDWLFFVFLHFLFLFNCVPSVSPYIVYLIG